MDLPVEKSRLFIIEGVPGAGKDTLQKILKSKLEGKLIYEFSEQDLLFNWKHAWLEDIDEMRQHLHEKMLLYCENILQTNSDAVFILNRFHISYILYTKKTEKESLERYNKLLEKLRILPTTVLVPVVDKQDIESRSAHTERTDPLWKMHLNKRLEQKGFNSVGEMYADEQERIKAILDEQKIPYQLLSIDIPAKS